MNILETLIELSKRAKECPKDDRYWCRYNNDNKDKRRFGFSHYEFGKEHEFEIYKIDFTGERFFKSVAYKKIYIKISFNENGDIVQTVIGKQKGEDIGEFMLQLADYLMTLKEYDELQEDTAKLHKALSEISDKLIELNKDK